MRSTQRYTIGVGIGRYSGASTGASCTDDATCSATGDGPAVHAVRASNARTTNTRQIAQTTASSHQPHAYGAGTRRCARRALRNSTLRESSNRLATFNPRVPDSTCTAHARCDCCDGCSDGRPASTNSDVAAAVLASAEAPRLLLEHRYAASVDPDHVEEFVPEALRLGALAGFGGPLLGERARSRNSLRLSGIRCLPAPKDTTPMWRTPLMTISRRGTNGTSYEPERLDTRMQGS